MGLVDGGFDVLAAFDNWAPATRSYAANFDHPIQDTDLGSVDPGDLLDLAGIGPGDVDLVVGGPPCQGFSVQRIGADTDGRNDLVISFAEHVRAVRPRMLVMENVPGLLGKRGAALAREFTGLLEDAGYEIRWERINTAAYGVPQLRRRVLCYGWRREDVPPFSLPPGTVPEDDYVSVWRTIGDLPSPPEDCTPAPGDPLHRRMRLSAQNLRRLALIPPGGGFEHLPPEMRVPCHRDGPDKIGHRYVYGRLHPDRPAGTITARFDSFTRGKFAHPFEDRNITLREGARLQTFPDSHVLLGTQEEIAALIGNSVPPKMALHVVESIRAHLADETASREDQLGLWQDVMGRAA